MEKTEQGFDEKAKEAMTALFENFWIVREEEPELYQKIREREKVLKRYLQEKFGYRLIIHRYFAKLEKIPAEPESWMGIQDFQDILDYALFCCLLAYLESKAVDEKFLLSDLCEEIQAMYPGNCQSIGRIINIGSRSFGAEDVGANWYRKTRRWGS